MTSAKGADPADALILCPLDRKRVLSVTWHPPSLGHCTGRLQRRPFVNLCMTCVQGVQLGSRRQCPPCRFAKGGRGWSKPTTGGKQDAQAFREEVRAKRLKKKTEQRKQRSSAHSQRQRGPTAEELRRGKPGHSVPAARGGVRKPVKGKPAGRRKR